MTESFPQFSSTLVKSYHVQNLPLSPKELQNLQTYSKDSYDFYQIVLKCKQKDLKKNFTCISNSYKDTPCSAAIQELSKCKSYLSNDNSDPNLCFKQDRNFSSCIDDLYFPIIYLKSHLPLRFTSLS